MNGEEATRFRISFQHNFSHELTPEQVKLLDQLADFTLTDDKHKLLLLAGYAGTGKTSMLATYVKTLRLFRLKSRLLAPTGRAAKVLAGKAGKEAYTIHKQLYRKQDGSDELSSVSMMPNLHTDTVFVVDEASMIPEYTINTDGSVGRDLLTDLIEYVYSGKNCSMVLLGDK
ncbi:MAG: AAA family ATPase, partial [Bacteroidota bacterium]